MTMIRINLIAEKKAGAAKTIKIKTPREQSQIQENLIIVVMALVAGIICFLLYRNVKQKLEDAQAENRRLTAEYKELEIWTKKKEDYEIQKILLNEKIQKIRDLKNRREGPVKIMEDVFNALPDSVWFSTISQGYDRKLVQASDKDRTAFAPGPRNMGDPALVKVTGYAKTTEAITNFADRLLKLDARYFDTELNNIEQTDDPSGGGKAYFFEIFFKVRSGLGAPDGAQAAADGG